MATEDDQTHIETDAARGGSTPHIVRWILAVSLFAAIALLSVIWITGAATRSEPERNVSYPPPAADSGSDTGSIAGENTDEIEAPAPSDTAPERVPSVEN